MRQIVINCYKYHGREDLLPAFSEEDEQVAMEIPSGSNNQSNQNNDQQTVMMQLIYCFILCIQSYQHNVVLFLINSTQ